MWGADLIYTEVFHYAGGGTSNPFVAQGSAGRCLIRLGFSFAIEFYEFFSHILSINPLPDKWFDIFFPMW